MHISSSVSRVSVRAAASAALVVLAAGAASPTASIWTADPIVLTQWLVLGPLPTHAPAFGAAGDSALLAASRLTLARGWPAAGRSVAWLDGRSATWTAQSAAGGSLQLAATPAAATSFAVAYLETDTWARAKLTVQGGARQVVTLDGAPVRGDITLTRGKHVLLVQSLQPAGAALTLSARVEPLTPEARISVSLDPRHRATLNELLAAPDVQGIAVDPTGRRVAWVVRTLDDENDRQSNEIEVRDLATGNRLAQLAVGVGASTLRWSRDGAKLGWLSATDQRGSNGRDLWVWDAAQAGTVRVLRAERGLGDFEWSAKGDWIYFTASSRNSEPESYKAGDVQHLTDVWQRWSFWGEKAQLYALDVRAGTRLKLAGDTSYSVEAAKLSPDGTQLVFARNVRTTDRPPWLRAEVWVLGLSDLAARKLLDLPREAFGGPSAFAWSPDGKAVAFCASAKEMLTGEDSTFSVYENKLYATSVDRPALVNLSAAFVPSMACTREMYWSAKDQRLYAGAEAGARTIIARTTGPLSSSLSTRPPLEEVRGPGESITAYSFGGETLVAAIQTPVAPATVYRIPLATGAAAVLDRPAGDQLAGNVAMPTWRPWEFTNSHGTKIEAWYWLPPDFDSTRTYPMIVHYYGGTLPMKKSFDQRLVWFAANGYVVFMLNPAGAPGYGQAFANLHINDWGYPAGSDIIEGVEQFEKTHRFVDARHVGNFGHSYGGFMTMHLATRTNLFASSIEIAGISNIADYWGAGWTGYSYTDGTCPGCYPWNRKDVYVDRSPLFQADKIKAPMLLIHGTDDTNVVPTESEQMFTALRMLGRDAELVRFYGENHGINSRPSVTRSLYGVMLDWYDKQLRGRPEAWSARWNRSPNGPARADSLSTAQR